MEPETDREFAIEMNGNIRALTAEIKHLAENIKVMDENRISPMETRLTILEKWQNNFDGGWKAVIVILTLLTIVSISLGILSWNK